MEYLQKSSFDGTQGFFDRSFTIRPHLDPPNKQTLEKDRDEDSKLETLKILHTHTHISGSCLNPWRNRFYFDRLFQKKMTQNKKKEMEKNEVKTDNPSTRRGRGCSFSQCKAEETGGDGVR